MNFKISPLFFKGHTDMHIAIGSKSDIFACGLNTLLNRPGVTVLSPILSNSGLIIVSNRPTKTIKWIVFVKPFTVRVWYYIFITMAIAALAVYFTRIR